MLKQYAIPIISFLLFIAPGAVDSWWSLFERLTNGDADRQVAVNISPFVEAYQLIFPFAGLLLLMFWIWWTRKPATSNQQEYVDDNERNDSNTVVQEEDTVIVRDALEHLIVETRRQDNLVIEKAFTPWRVGYPIHIRNTRPAPIEIIGYNATLLWSDSPLPRIEWRAPDGEANNGMSLQRGDKVEALTIQPDDSYTLHVYVNIARTSNPPAISPRWGLRGTVMFRCGEEPYDKRIDLHGDYYEMKQEDWQQWLAQVSPSL